MQKPYHDLETRLAKSSRKLAALRDPEKNYNKITPEALNKLATEPELAFLPAKIERQ